MADGALEKIDTLAYDKAIWHYNLERPVPVHTAKVGWVSGDTNSVSGER
jgi:hypothetical protein